MKQLKQKTVLCDVDGVVADFMPEWLRMYNEEYKDTLTVDRITEWDIHKFVLPECDKKIYSYVLQSNFYDHVAPVKGAVEAITHLRGKYRVVFVTSGLVPAKIKWLHDWGFLEATDWEYDPDYVIACDKSLIKGDYLIDDGSHNCRAFPGVAMCFDQPWNRDYKGFRAKDWRAVLNILYPAGGPEWL